MLPKVLRLAAQHHQHSRMKKDAPTAKKAGSSSGRSGNKKPDLKSSPGVRKQQGTKPPQGRQGQGGRQQPSRPWDKHQAAARALLRGSGLSAGSLSALLDQTAEELRDKNVKCQGAAAAAGRQGPAPTGIEPSPRQSHPPAAPPPTPAEKPKLAGTKPSRLAPNDPGSVLESLSSWGL
ncbi:hypothetical protein PLESTM_001612700 [Pleodorina starrii]|nr:hypothetical protein PLESTM_001612700 [Pleodorina starrii]